MKIIFLGTNGWYPTETGNTVSVLVDTPSRYIVLDAGDGIHRLDKYATDVNKPVDIFLSHFHLDHTIGLHIQPKFHFKNKIRIFGQQGAKEILDTLVNKPFTASFELLRKKLGFQISVHELSEGENKIDEYIVHAAPLVHADPCWGFRFKLGGKILCYCTDTGPCENFDMLAKNSDMLITECSNLSADSFDAGWPHLNPQLAAQIAKKAGCKKLVLSHFAAHKYTTLQKRLEAEADAKKIFENTIAARDGLELDF